MSMNVFNTKNRTNLIFHV